MIAYHFTGATLRDGRKLPAVGEWLEFAGDIVPCKSGLHASPDPFDALQYAPGAILHQVELDGTIIPHGDPVDKWAASKRRIIKSADLTDACRQFAREQALSVIHLWNAPAVVRQYLETGDETKRQEAAAAARKAWRAAKDAAAAAWAEAREAVRAAAWAAADAAVRAARRAEQEAAWAGANAAAWLAREAAWAATRAADAAAWAAAANAAAAPAEAQAATWNAVLAAARSRFNELALEALEKDI